MGCVSSKILAKSGSFQEKVSGLGHHGFQRSSAIEEIILSTSKSSGDQFLALLRTSSTSSSSARNPKEPAEAHSPAPPPAAAARIETIDVCELLAGLEEGSCCTAGEDQAPPRPASAGRARSFRTVEELDAMLLLTQQHPQQQEDEEPATPTAAAAAGEELARGSEAAAGAKRRARARRLGELEVPAAAFDFSKSGSLRDWLRQGGQTFSPGSYVTPRFGTPAAAAAERGGAAGEKQALLFDPELVAQFERAMEQLSEDEGRVLDQILEAAEKDGAAAAVDESLDVEKVF